MLAKVNGTTLVTYPYGLAELQADNPYTAFSSNDVAELFKGTEANLAGNTLVEVTIPPPPPYSEATQNIALSSEPKLENDVWALEWTVSAKPQEDLAAQQAKVAEGNKNKAKQLLAETDWVELPSVTNTANTPHLINAADFITYRNTLRSIAVNPPDTEATWPTIPAEQWAT